MLFWETLKCWWVFVGFHIKKLAGDIGNLIQVSNNVYDKLRIYKICEADFKRLCSFKIRLLGNAAGAVEPDVDNSMETSLLRKQLSRLSDEQSDGD